MSAQKVRLPAWLDIVLEGGGFELERACVRYRQLRRLLRRDWRPHAREVCAACDALLEREAKVLAAEARAVRRASLDPRARAALELVSAVVDERARLHRSLVALNTGGRSFQERLAALANVAEDESLLEGPWKLWRYERALMTFTALGVLIAVPLESLFAAMKFRTHPDWFDMRAGVLPALPVMIGAAIVLIVADLRLYRYVWMGIRVPWPGAAGHASLSGIAATAGLAARMMHSPEVLLSAVIVLCGFAAQVLYAIWSQPRGPLIDQLVSSSSTGENPAASHEAST